VYGKEKLFSPKELEDVVSEVMVKEELETTVAVLKTYAKMDIVDIKTLDVNGKVVQDIKNYITIVDLFKLEKIQ